MHVHQVWCRRSWGQLASRHLLGAPASSRCAFRFASTLPDGTSTSADPDPAGSPVDLQEHWLQAPGNADTIAQTSSPALDGPIGAAVRLIDGLHTVTGLPWWATLSVTAVGVRAALFPLAVRQIQASTGIARVMNQVQQNSPPSQVTKQQQLQHTLQKVSRLLKEQSLPSPLWILAAPLAQIPVFLTAVIAVRRMSATAWPGFDTGGLFWFSDLCQPALNLAAATAPLGSIGVVLPAGVAVAMFANIQRSFGVTPNSRGGAGGTVMVWVMGNVKLLLEWLTIPLFIIALQLPQGAALYWLVSSLTALAQGYILQLPSARAALGLPSAPVPLSAASQQGTPPPQASPKQQALINGPAVKGTPRAVPTVMKGTKATPSRQPQPVDMEKLLTVSAAVRKLAAGSSDVHALLLKAAELRAEGAVAASQHCLERILDMEPTLAAGQFAMGQNHAALREWPLAEQAFLAAADLHQDVHQQARCWFGAGISQQMQGEHDAALQSLDIAENLSSEILEPGEAQSVRHGSTSSSDSSTSDQDAPSEGKTENSSSRLAECQRTQELAVKTLLGKTFLAKASIFAQLGRTHEANECMKSARMLDPAIGKYIKH